MLIEQGVQSTNGSVKENNYINKIQEVVGGP